MNIKKSVLAIATIVGLLGLTGCTNQPKPQAPKCSIDGSDNAPHWVCDNGSTMEGGIFAVGSAEPSPLGRNFQVTTATAAARDALAREMSVKVKNMFKKFQATTGVGKDQTVDQAIQNVSKQLAKVTLTGSKPVQFWTSPKGTLYVLVGMPNKIAEEKVKNAVKTSFKNNKALWQKFLAQKADKNLDKEIAKEFGSEN